MIEVVIALATLVTASGMILGAVSFMEGTAARNTARLEAMEVAHRVVMQYIDEPEQLKQFNRRYDYNLHTYYFELTEEVLQVDENTNIQGLTRRETQRAEDLSMQDILQSQLQQITVTVYRTDPGSPDGIAATPDAQLTRLFSPINLFERDNSRLLDWINGVLSNEGVALTEDEEEGGEDE